MDKNIFWAFFILALIVGLGFGFTLEGYVLKAGTEALQIYNEDDGGLTYNVAGTCIKLDGQVLSDSCSDNKLTEYYFDSKNKVCSSKIVDCVLMGYARCASGACTNEEIQGTATSCHLKYNEQTEVYDCVSGAGAKACDCSESAAAN